MIRLIRPYITFDEVSSQIEEILDSGLLTRGKYVARFAATLAAYTGAAHAHLTTSATTALSVTLKVLGVAAGDEVVVSDFSFPATANVVEDLGARPVFADVSYDTYNMLAEQLEARITQRTKAVIYVDAFGSPSGSHAIREICRARGVPMVEDAACALGSSENGIAIGAIADLSCFSFHPRKLLTAGEGGAITTQSDEFAALLAVKLNHGCGEIVDGHMDFSDIGYNYRMSEIQAALALAQVDKLDAIVDARTATRDVYQKLLEPMGFAFQQVHDGCRHNQQSIVVRVPEGVDRDDLIRGLKQAGVESTLGTYCLSGTTYYRGKYQDVQPNASWLQNHTLTLPCYDGVPVELVCEAIANSL